VIGCDQIDRTLKSIGRSDQLKSAVETKNGLVGLYDRITGYGNSNTKQMQWRVQMLSQRKGASPQHKIVFDGYGVVGVVGDEVSVKKRIA